jgi:translation elongation factor EF-Tu-like GTPase
MTVNNGSIPELGQIVRAPTRMSHKFQAKAVFFSSKDGGRITPPQSGFRPQVEIGSVHTSCMIEGTDENVVFVFGVEHEVLLTLMHPGQFSNAFRRGDLVTFFEGQKKIGMATILDDGTG